MSIPTLKKAENGYFYIVWSRNRRSLRVSTRSKQINVATQRLGEWLLENGTTEERATAEAPTLANLWALYAKKRKSVTNDFSWKQLQGTFGTIRIAGPTSNKLSEHYRLKTETPVKDAIRRYMWARVDDGVASGTVRREIATLMAMLRWSADQGFIPVGAIPKIALPEDSEPRDRWLRLPEVQKLLKAAAELRVGSRLSRGERFLWLALETAARKSAICELTWDRVDFETGVVHYDVPGRKKTKKRRSSVAISKALRPVLERAYAERANDFVLDNASEVWKIVHDIADHAGVADVSPHVLRHTAATLMARRGVPLWTISNILGNSLVMVEKVYAKHCPEAMAAAVEMISGGVLEPAE